MPAIVRISSNTACVGGGATLAIPSHANTKKLLTEWLFLGCRSFLGGMTQYNIQYYQSINKWIDN